MEQGQQLKACQRLCQKGQCGSLNKGQVSNLNTTDKRLCRSGEVFKFLEKKKDNILIGWAWSCQAQDQTVDCEATNQTPGSAQCGLQVDSCLA